MPQQFGYCPICNSPFWGDKLQTHIEICRSNKERSEYINRPRFKGPTNMGSIINKEKILSGLKTINKFTLVEWRNWTYRLDDDDRRELGDYRIKNFDYDAHLEVYVRKIRQHTYKPSPKQEEFVKNLEKGEIAAKVAQEYLDDCYKNDPIGRARAFDVLKVMVHLMNLNLLGQKDFDVHTANALMAMATGIEAALDIDEE